MAEATRITIDGADYFLGFRGKVVRETERELPPDRNGRIWKTPVRRAIKGPFADQIRAQLEALKSPNKE